MKAVLYAPLLDDEGSGPIAVTISGARRTIDINCEANGWRFVEVDEDDPKKDYDVTHLVEAGALVLREG